VNAVVFEQYALNAVESIFTNQNVTVMVGGTGLYIRAFCEGMDVMPAIDPAIRNQITVQYEMLGLEWLQLQVQEKDPVFWKIAEQANPQRLMRALEMIMQTGVSITSFRQQKKQERPFRIVKLGLELPREVLYKRINNRVEEMMKQGLLQEVESLRAFSKLNALQTVGYKEIFENLDGKLSIEEAVENIKKNTRHYAKRQMTWFKKDAEICWLQASDDKLLEKAVASI
jgi:tRNA dimethylallyltransferase